MKNFASTFLFLFLFPITLFCQSGYLDNNPIWSLHSACAVNGPWCIQQIDYNYYTHGDSVLNSHVYKKLYYRGNQQFIYNNGQPPPPDCQGPAVINDTNNIVALIRDTLNKIFIFDNNHDTLLYDFNLSVNDTLPLSFNNGATDITVVAIDSILIGQVYRKIFRLSSNSMSTNLVEGVGHEGGFLERMNIGFDCGYSLLCFGLGDSAYYPSSGPTCHLLLTGVDESLESPKNYVYPSPFDKEIIIHSTGTHGGNLFVQNIMGKIVFNQKFDEGQTIDLSFLDSGVYLFRIETGNKIYIDKVLKVLNSE